MPGEAIFVPDPDGKEEDDGVLVSVILQCKEQYSYLAVIDAKTMQEIATARAPNMIPMGFHGAFVRK
jgi:torulene dioxygenase